MKEGIELRGVSCRAKVGVPAWERRRRQAVVLDLALEVPVAKASRSDRLEDSVDYWAVEKAVRAAVEGSEFRLLERLAGTAAAAALACDRRIRAVHVAAAKTPAVMPRTRAVVVRLSRSRS